MIDREARDKAAEILRQFISGQITNFAFEEKMPQSRDSAILAIEDSMWCFYDDFKKHKMKGKWKLPEETKKEMARWVMFLYSNEEYKWPNYSYAGVLPLRHGWFSKLRGKPRKEKEFMQFGEYEVWPFLNKESYESALQNSKLLYGS